MTLLLLGAAIGFVAGVSPGPVLTLVVTETMKGGWLRGEAVAAGPLLADGPIIVVAVLIAHELPAGFVPSISFVGGVFLLYLAITIALNARRAELPTDRSASARGGFATGLLARALSPHPYLFWFLVGGPTLLQAGPQAGVAFLVGYYATIVGSNVGLALALHRWIGLVSQRLYRALLLAAGLILAAYGVLLVGRAMDSATVEVRNDRYGPEL